MWQSAGILECLIYGFLICLCLLPIFQHHILRMFSSLFISDRAWKHLTKSVNIYAIAMKIQMVQVRNQTRVSARQVGHVPWIKFLAKGQSRQPWQGLNIPTPSILGLEVSLYKFLTNQFLTTIKYLVFNENKNVIFAMG